MINKLNVDPYLKLMTVLNRYSFQISTLMLSLLIASMSVALYGIYENLVELYFNPIPVNEEDSKKLLSDLMENVFFTIFFVFLIFGTFKIYFKLLRQKRASSKEIKLKESKPKQDDYYQNIKNPTQSAKKRAIIYLILLPISYIIFLIVGISIVYPNRTEVSILELQSFAFYPMFLMWGLMGIYLRTQKKMDTAKEFFAKSNYEYIISERIFVGKIRTVSVLSMIGFLSILIIFNSFFNTQDSDSSFIEWTTFSISFGMFNVVLFSNMKISNFEKKKRFKLFVASGYCKNCLKYDECKVKNLTWSLKWYEDFLKKLKHCGKIKIDSVIIRILASDSRNSTLKELSMKLESDNDYDAINKIADIMNVNVDELFINETLGQKIKSVLVLIGGIVTIFGFAYQTIITFMNSL